MGTPQVRWRLMHQSGRDSTALRIRFSPESGTHCTGPMAAKALVRAEEPVAMGLSRATNHWSTARKMIGVFERQQCG